MRKIIIVFVWFISIIPALAQQPEIFTKSDEAINGYDAVAYFKEGKSVKGKKEYSFRWKDATWYFASEQNLKDFKNNPEKFAPQYGGYCAYGMSNGYKATTSPDAWTIVNGKLYLNYDTGVRELWNKDQANFIKKADANWPAVKVK